MGTGTWWGHVLVRGFSYFYCFVSQISRLFHFSEWDWLWCVSYSSECIKFWHRHDILTDTSMILQRFICQNCVNHKSWQQTCQKWLNINQQISSFCHQKIVLLHSNFICRNSSISDIKRIQRYDLIQHLISVYRINAFVLFQNKFSLSIFSKF